MRCRARRALPANSQSPKRDRHRRRRRERHPPTQTSGEVYEADAATGGTTLRVAKDQHGQPYGALTIQGGLDKLAANLAIGRDFRGVHYSTDHYESIRMGERIAVGMLQEEMLTYREPVSMRFRSFDGDYVAVVCTGGARSGPGDPADAIVTVRDETKAKIDTAEWWNRALGTPVPA